MRATVVSQPAGLSGMPVRGHRSRAATTRLLHGILGQREVADEPGEGGHHSAALHPDRIGDGPFGAAQSNATIGRISILPPRHAPGILADQAMASSRSFTSSR